MARWNLSDREWDALDAVRFSTTDADVFRNATIILMSGAGRSKQSIADDLGCCPATVDNVRKRYRQQGVSGLAPRKSPGRRSGGHRRISASPAPRGANAATDVGIWIQRLVGGPVECAPARRKPA